MDFIVYKNVTTSDAQELGRYMDQGFSVQRIRSVGASSPMAGGTRKAIKPKRKIRRRRPPLKVTPDLVQKMAAMRKEGMLYRIIGRRFGVTGARAWQIVNLSKEKVTA